jgi:hypothetical protein
MRSVAALLLLLAATCATSVAGDGGRSDVEVFVPVDPYEHERLHWFGNRDRHLVPGTVTINKAPYVCDPDGRRFRDREAFVAHLRSRHAIAPDDIPGRLVVVDGIVHFIRK